MEFSFSILNDKGGGIIKKVIYTILALSLSFAAVYFITYSFIPAYIEGGNDEKNEAAEQLNESTHDELDHLPQKEAEDIEKSNEVVKKAHQTMNELTGHGAIAKYRDENNWSGSTDEMRNEVERVSGFLEKNQVDSESIEKDLTNFVDLLDHAIEDKNKTALRYAHRVIHDLDIAYNGYQNSNIFGVSHYNEEEREVRMERLEELLAESGE
ncbi:hypothetical protein [Salisediminibacterium halotolerans]|uniref:hypothetical protein n=1 Tax=Salisediminibacterium halotolerans TaxID=517425 RepID=UPI000EB22E65|nr:hypothetical protein [Salisediminibacterium halotolerans]RLJ69266.1 hypothetical protein BCL39_2761 [Actinophytocola xinjiangensis]RPE86999.1 hypothetical protein EDD67_1863 [Salisediminibacterium halotolerans]TWG32268.1 hypothetical protein BCL52_2756 [Salisediminibacterium halotolerans]GEL07993.1 hypothetical protein SHA02_14090 [Salisediminibacterium halotolerans]